MKHTTGYTLLLMALMALTASCTQDAYDKGEGYYSQMVAEMVDGYTASDKRVTHFVTDDDVRYTVANPFMTSLMEKADTVYRAIFYFNKDEQGQAEVIGLDRVGVLRPLAMEAVKTDPVKMESVWMGKSKRYLNLSLYLMTGATTDKDALHRMGCCRDTLMLNDDGTRTLHLTLYHDQGGMPEYYSSRAYFSIPLTDTDADSVVLRVNTYEGILTKCIELQEVVAP